MSKIVITSDSTCDLEKEILLGKINNVKKEIEDYINNKYC